VIVLSDHGFNSFQRGVHLNTWLHDHGFLRLAPGVKPGPEAGDFLRHVDWGRSSAYALGMGSIYLNLKGRERDGIIPPGEAPRVKEAIGTGLTGLKDQARGELAIRGIVSREQAYSGAYAAESPDLVVNFGPGYRVS